MAELWRNRPLSLTECTVILWQKLPTSVLIHNPTLTSIFLEVACRSLAPLISRCLTEALDRLYWLVTEQYGILLTSNFQHLRWVLLSKQKTVECTVYTNKIILTKFKVSLTLLLLTYCGILWPRPLTFSPLNLASLKRLTIVDSNCDRVSLAASRVRRLSIHSGLPWLHQLCSSWSVI